MKNHLWGGKARRKENGAFLLITMVTMIAMVLAGLLVMEMAMLGEVTVGNEQRTLEVYQVAYSELEAQLDFLESNADYFHNAMSGNQTLPVQMTPGGCGNTGQICQSVTLRYLGDGPPPPGYSLGHFISMLYEIDSVATLEGTGARSSQTMGVIFVNKASGG